MFNHMGHFRIVLRGSFWILPTVHEDFELLHLHRHPAPSSAWWQSCQGIETCVPPLLCLAFHVGGDALSLFFCVWTVCVFPGEVYVLIWLPISCWVRLLIRRRYFLIAHRFCMCFPTPHRDHLLGLYMLCTKYRCSQFPWSLFIQIFFYYFMSTCDCHWSSATKTCF